MHLEWLDCLIAIDQYHSMNKAAEHIFISQQSISSNILQLEEEFQTQLVLRTNKGSFLTEAGKSLVLATQEFYSRCNQVKEQIKIAEEEHIYLLFDYSQLALWEKLYVYYTTFQADVILNRTMADYLNLEATLKQDNKCIAVVYLHQDLLEQLKKQFHCEIITKQFLLVCVSTISPLARNKIISMNSIHNMKILLSSSPDKPSALYYALQRYHLEEKNNKFIYNITTALQAKLAEQLDVVSFVPESSRNEKHLSSLISIPLKEKIPLYLCCVTAKGREIPKTLIQALETLNK